MGMRTVAVEIKGKSPLLMHRFPMEPIEAIEKKTKEEQAEISAYRLETGELYVPSVNLQRSFVNAGTFSKGKGRATLQKPVAACVQVSPFCLGLGVAEYEIDARRVVIGATRGAIIRFRPRIDEWSLAGEIEYDDTLLTEPQLRDVVDNAGSRVGVLDFRPEKKGPFGRFFVTRWKLLPVT